MNWFWWVFFNQLIEYPLVPNGSDHTGCFPCSFSWPAIRCPQGDLLVLMYDSHPSPRTVNGKL